MDSTMYEIKVFLPSVEEFGQRFPQYGPRAADAGRELFDLVMRAETFVDADALTRVLRLPAVTAVSSLAGEVLQRDLTGTDRQFLGALTCALMEANGYEKTGQKRAIPHPDWNRGEVYRRAS